MRPRFPTLAATDRQWHLRNRNIFPAVGPGVALDAKHDLLQVVQGGGKARSTWVCLRWLCARTAATMSAIDYLDGCPPIAVCHH